MRVYAHRAKATAWGNMLSSSVLRAEASGSVYQREEGIERTAHPAPSFACKIMAKRSKRKEREKPMVQCDRCRRWAYLDDTDFACTDTAHVAPFTCNFCNVVESLETRLRASEQEVETLGRVVRTSPKEDTLEVRQPEVKEGNGQSPQKPQEQRSAPKTTLQSNENALQGDYIADRTTEAASGSKEQAGEASSTEKAGKKRQRTEAESNGAAANGRPNTNTQKARRQKRKKAAPDSAPEILIIGDGNVPPIAGALRRIWDKTVRVEQRFERKATADRLHHLLRRHNDRVMEQDWATGASKEQRQAQPHTSREIRPKCHRPGNANRNSATTGDENRGSQHAPQGVQRQHPGPPSADILNEHGASADPKHTAIRAKGAPSSTDIDTTRGQHPSCNGPMATTQPRCAPRLFPHGSSASGSTLAAAGHLTRHAPKLAIMKRRRHRRRRKKDASAIVGFLNIHGGRKNGKWEELYRMLETENMSLYAVAETHLLGLEEPGSRKGGIGALWRNGIDGNWKKLEGSCKEHMSMTGGIMDMPMLVAVLYFSVDPGQTAENRCIAQCIAEDIQRWGFNREVLIRGDFNGHVQSIDGFQDHNVELMLQLADTFSLEVANLRPDCIDETAWSARNSRSCINYILTSPILAAHLSRVHVDESGRYSLSSDHNRIALTFSTSVHRNRQTECRKLARRYIPAASFERVAEDFEENYVHVQQTTYEEFVGELRRSMCHYEKRIKSRGGTRPKAWLDQQVKTALEAQRTSNRAHGYTVKHSSIEECQQTWQDFLRCKRDMQQMMQKKLAESNQKQLLAITEAGNNGPRKFWTYISSLNRESSTTTIGHATGQAVTDLEEHLTTYMQRMHENPSAEQEMSYQAREKRCEMDNSTTVECEWKVSRVAIDRAISSIGAHSAEGLDGIPPGLVKQLGQKARETLACIFTGIINGDPIPEEWRLGKLAAKLARCFDGDEAPLTPSVEDYPVGTMPNSSQHLSSSFTDFRSSWGRIHR
ncbi:hypothetical protein HPB50_001877 [Hyalomma asiaticum]|uniref:Uncharacterized protein n=1 Tax=Hyalomma asiaticum TaxID=266040 RepID=A0ACB7S2D7_HYAAI|nr:hypothetical protein HPB50_001877 [Hyalomma asiaticum]